MIQLCVMLGELRSIFKFSKHKIVQVYVCLQNIKLAAQIIIHVTVHVLHEVPRSAQCFETVRQSP